MHFSGWRLSYMKFFWRWEKVCFPWASYQQLQLKYRAWTLLMSLSDAKTVVSSAKWTKRIWFEDLYMSLIYKRKSTGPNTDTCGTPNAMFDVLFPVTQIRLKPVLHDISNVIMQKLAHQYVMINGVECFWELHFEYTKSKSRKCQ